MKTTPEALADDIFLSIMRGLGCNTPAEADLPSLAENATDAFLAAYARRETGEDLTQ